MGPRRDVSEERRTQILEAATAVFSRSGFNGASMDDIAEKAGLSKGSLYWYFNSKEDIILAILDAMIFREYEAFEDLNAQSLSAEELLISILDFALEDLADMQSMLPILFEYWGMIQRKKKIRERLGKYYKEMFAVLRPIIQQGVENGEFRPADVEEVAISIGAVFEGMIILWAAVPEQVDLRKNITAGIKLILDGIKTRDTDTAD